VGDTITLAAPRFYSTLPKTFNLLVTKVDTNIIDGLPLRTVYTKHISLYYFIPKYTERIGGYSVATIIAIDRNKTAMHTEGLRCYHDKEIDEKFVSDTWDCDYVPTNIEEKKNQNDIQVFPNPASRFINVNLNTSKTNGIVYLFSIEGKLLIQKVLNEPKTQIDIQHLPKGQYLIQIKNETETFSKLITVLH
jgi:hypothetical protein